MEPKKIELTSGKNAIVDACNFNRLDKFTWRAARSSFVWYAIRRQEVNGHVITTKMHRLVANTPNDLVCHHVNGNGLDNRQENLQNLYPLEHKNLHIMARHQRKLEGSRQKGRPKLPLSTTEIAPQGKIKP